MMQSATCCLALQRRASGTSLGALQRFKCRRSFLSIIALHCTRSGVFAELKIAAHRVRNSSVRLPRKLASVLSRSLALQATASRQCIQHQSSRHCGGLLPALDRHCADTPLARLPTPVSIACVFVCDVCLVAVHPAALLSFFFLPVPRSVYMNSVRERVSHV